MLSVMAVLHSACLLISSACVAQAEASPLASHVYVSMPAMTRNETDTDGHSSPYCITPALCTKKALTACKSAFHWALCAVIACQ